MTLWLEASSGVRLRSRFFGVIRPMTPTSSSSSKPAAAPSGLTGVFFALLVGRPDPKTPCLLVGVASTIAMGEVGEKGRAARAGEVIVFCRFAEGRSELAGSSPAVGDENIRNRFFAAARCASWDSGVVSPNRGNLLVPVLSGEVAGGTSTRILGSSGAPCPFLGEAACGNDGVIDAWRNPAVRVTNAPRLRSG
jgi:hypothetical protein